MSLDQSLETLTTEAAASAGVALKFLTDIVKDSTASNNERVRAATQIKDILIKSLEQFETTKRLKGIEDRLAATRAANNHE